MKSWPLKLKFGLYAAGLSTVALAVSMAAVRPLVYRHQLLELDRQLQDDAEELFRDMENFRGAPRDFRKPITQRFIPVSLQRRYLEIQGPEQQVLYRSANLRGKSLGETGDGLRTVILSERNARIGTFRHGFLTLHIGTRLGTIETVQDDLQYVLWRVGPGIAVAVFGAGWLLGRRALRPVTELSEAAARISANAPDERLPEPAARDEIHRMTVVLNASFERLQQSYAAAARFSADASHQLKTPLSVLRAGLDHLRSQGSLAPADAVEVEAMLKQTRRLTTIIEDLLLLARIDAGQINVEAETVDLSGMLSALADDLEAMGEARHLQVELVLPENLTALGDSRRVAMILQNLGENAVKYADAGGMVKISAGLEAGQVVTRIANTGRAIPEPFREQLFERFHRAGAAEDVKGHGLGLNIARSLARAMQGEVALERSGAAGTEFSLTLPPVPTAA